MRLIVTLAVIAAAIAIYVAIEALDDEPRRCPSCGLESLSRVYQPPGRGWSDGPTHRCNRCGAEYRRE